MVKKREGGVPAVTKGKAMSQKATIERIKKDHANAIAETGRLNKILFDIAGVLRDDRVKIDDLQLRAARLEQELEMEVKKKLRFQLKLEAAQKARKQAMKKRRRR